MRYVVLPARRAMPRVLWLWVIALAAVMLAPAASSAQDCFVDKALPGTVNFTLAREAINTNAQAYGAVGTLERRILPQLHDIETKGWTNWDKGGGIFYLGSESIYDVIRVPATIKGACDFQLSTAPLDLNSYNLGFGFRGGGITFFYVGGAQTGYLVDDAYSRVGFSLINFMIGHVYNIGAPLFGSSENAFGAADDGVSRVRVDYLVGGSIDLLVADLTIGYLGSSGYYASLDQPKVKAFTRALITEGAGEQELSYLSVGKDAFDWWNPDGFQGTTSAWVRKLRLAMPGLDALTPAARDAALEQLDLWTAHLAQRDILDYVDLQGAYTFQPTGQLQELRLTAHSPNYNLALRPAEALKRKNRKTELWPVEFSASIGVSQYPRMSWFGIEDGLRMTFNTDILLIPDRQRYQGGYVRMRLMRNDPEILDIFPYGVDAWQLHLSWIMAIAE